MARKIRKKHKSIKWKYINDFIRIKFITKILQIIIKRMDNDLKEIFYLSKKIIELRWW